MVRFDLSNYIFNINFEYVAILIMIACLFYMFIEKLIIMKRSMLFAILIVLSIISTTFDIFRANISNKIVNGEMGLEYFSVVNALETSHMLILFLSIFGFVLYVIYITCGIQYLKKKKLELLSFFTPITIVTILTLVNYFYPIIVNYGYEGTAKFYEVNLYVYFTVIFIEVSYLALAIRYISKYKIIFDKKQILAIAFIPFLMAAGFVVEFIFSRYLVLSFMIALCIIIVQTTFESSEDMIDENTNLYNVSEFIRTLKKIYLNGDSKFILLFKITNYSELMKIYDLAAVRKYEKLVTHELNEIRNKNRVVDTLFSLNNGYYASLFDLKTNHDFESDNIIVEALRSIKSFNDFNPIIEECLIEVTKDFENADEAANFVGNYRQSITFKKDFTKYSDVSNNQNLIISNHLEQIIDTALREKEFAVYYQPIYSIEKKKFISAEALVRLVSKKYGFISPASFIPYAEKTGRIDEIDAFVMEEVFKFVSSTVFKMLGLSYIEINLSMAECVSPSLVRRIRELMIKYNVDPSHINMEITESFEASDLEMINENLKKISEMGFRLSLDDYGTGYSNINRFRSLPISIVKIDKSLVDESEDEGIKKILDYSFNMVRDLNKETVVEGVETKEQLDRFIDLGADFIQGYYFSKPLDFDKFIDFIYQRNM